MKISTTVKYVLTFSIVSDDRLGRVRFEGGGLLGGGRPTKISVSSVSRQVYARHIPKLATANLPKLVRAFGTLPLPSRSL